MRRTRVRPAARRSRRSSRCRDCARGAWTRSARSLRQLPQAQPDQRRGVGALAGVTRRRRDGGGRLRLAVAEIDQRRHRIGDRPAARASRRARPPDAPSPDRRSAKAGALSFSSVTMRSATFGPTPGARAIVALSRIAIAEARSPTFSVPSTESATLAPTPCTVCKQAEPFALDVAGKAEQPDLVLAHVGLDRQRRRLRPPPAAPAACAPSNAPDSRRRRRRG